VEIHREGDQLMGRDAVWWPPGYTSTRRAVATWLYAAAN
jgi:hypothetical protein